MRTNEAGYPFFALSPIAGIGMVATIGDEGLATAIQSSAITPALLFTFVFNYLLIGARRRVIKAVYIAAANLEPTRRVEASPLDSIPRDSREKSVLPEPLS